LDKLIINAAITGMVPTKEMTPHVPISPEEIAEDVRRCRDAGASIVHLHARDENGKPTYRRDVYEQILRSVRNLCPDIILCISTSGRVFKSFDERSEPLGCEVPRPEMASLTLGSMNFANEESVNSPEMIRSLALRMQELGIVPEWECFDLGMVEYAHYLIRRNVLKPPFYCNILLGSLGTMSGNAFNLATAVRALPEGVTWAAAGIGSYQLQVNSLAIAMGGHVRVGIEDNIWYDADRTRLAANPDLIDRIVRIASAMGREIASPDEARSIIGLPAIASSRCEDGGSTVGASGRK
jgi:3-keto-5-aminohexanoate cleavage enzyme